MTCEVFEYEDEVIDTNVETIDRVVQTDGYSARLILSGIEHCNANTTLNFGVQQIFLRMTVTDILPHQQFLSVHHLAWMQLRLQL